MNVVVYIHGQGGSAAESEHYRTLLPDCEVVGMDYQAHTPWDAEAELHDAVADLKSHYENIILIANSIGAYYAMAAHLDHLVNVAFFISPVVDLEKLNGVILSDEYLRYVRNHPIKWNVPTHILYASDDRLIPFDAITDFAKNYEATLTVMEGGEHWFHTDEQMRFLDNWIKEKNIYDLFFMNRSSMVWKMTKRAGTMKRRETVPMSMPPTVPTPSERLPLAPTPVASARGRSPKTIVSDVIRMGRSRTAAASMAASMMPMP